MLKIAREDEERRGGALMAWWNGDGAAKVLARHGEALLLERATGPRSLAAMVADGQDDEASRILCDVAARLHAPRPGPPPDLVPLTALVRGPGAGRTDTWRPARSRRTRRRRRCWPIRATSWSCMATSITATFSTAASAAGSPSTPRDFWASGHSTSSTSCAILTPRWRWRRAASTVRSEVLAAAASLERRRLLDWTLAFAGLSAAWHLADGTPADLDFAVAALAVRRSRNDKRRKPCAASPFPANVLSRP